MLRRMSVEQNALTGSPISAVQGDIVFRSELLQVTTKSTAPHGNALVQMLRTLPSQHHRQQQPYAVELLVLSSPSWDWRQFFW